MRIVVSVVSAGRAIVAEMAAISAISAVAEGIFVPNALHVSSGLPELLQNPPMQIARNVAKIENVAVATA